MVKERQSDSSKRLEKINITVKGISVNDVVKFMRELFEPAHRELNGTITDYGDRTEIKAELTWKNKPVYSWIASRVNLAPEKAGQVKMLNDLYDDLLFQILYDMSPNSSANDDIPNWQTLEAMTLGLESLATYNQTLEHADLERSLKYLQLITRYAPGYALGYYFLGVAYSENRKEREAASMFAQIERMKGDIEEIEKIELKWNARLQRAASMVQEYYGRTTQYAAEKVLTDLIRDLRKASEGSKKEGEIAIRLLPLVEAELTYAYGTLFRLQTSIPQEDLKKKAEDAWKAANSSYEAAKAIYSDTERRDVLSRVQNAEGYTRFRIAQWEWDRSGSGKLLQDRDTNFMTASNVALKLLRDALEEQPNYYLAMQNLAMILDDERYDPDGEHLSEAEALYEQTRKIVPEDYYQYERLALIYWRRSRTLAVSALQRELIKKGIDSIRSAQKLREQPTRTSAIGGAYFFISAAHIETDDTHKKEDLKEAIEQATFAVQFGVQRDAERKVIAENVAKLMGQVAKELPDNYKTDKLALNQLAKKLSDNDSSDLTHR